MLRASKVAKLTRVQAVDRRKQSCPADAWKNKKDTLGVTAVIFLNSEWRQEWAGELVFFDRKADAVACVSPKPGRLVLSPCEVNHRSGIPSRLYFGTRDSLVIMFSVTADQSQAA
jgi:hypothetical protein